MAPAQALSIPTVGFGFRLRKSEGPTRTVAAAAAHKPQNHNHWGVGSKMGDHHKPAKSTVDVERLVEFLYDDLHHVFDEQGIDRTAYDEEVRFRDPLTKYDDIAGYLLNIALLRKFFRPQMILHWVKKVPSILFFIIYAFCSLHPSIITIPIFISTLYAYINPNHTTRFLYLCNPTFFSLFILFSLSLPLFTCGLLQPTTGRWVHPHIILVVNQKKNTRGRVS